MRTDTSQFTDNASIAQLDRATGFEPVGRRFESCWTQSIAQLLIFALVATSLSSCGFFRRRSKTRSGDIPKIAAVLPLANETYDLTAPVLVRYFLERAARKKGYTLSMTLEDINKNLRQLGINDGNQISPANIQQVGQWVKAEAVFHGTLLEFRQYPAENRTVIKAKFSLTEVQNGRVAWETQVEVEAGGLMKQPVKGVLSMDWDPKMIRALARGPAGKLPSKLVNAAAKSIPK